MIVRIILTMIVRLILTMILRMVVRLNTDDYGEDDSEVNTDDDSEDDGDLVSSGNYTHVEILTGNS